MRFTDKEVDVPRLGSFGTQRDDNRCGTVAPASEPVRQAMREARRGLTIRPAESVEGACAELETYVIHPAFYEGPAALLAAEYLRGALHIDPAEAPLLWARYAAAARLLGYGGPIPVPVVNPEACGRS